jgi:hypothetical protein
MTDSLVAVDRGKPSEEVIDGFAALKRIDQVLQWDARAGKDWRSAHDFRVGVNDSF